MYTYASIQRDSVNGWYVVELIVADEDFEKLGLTADDRKTFDAALFGDQNILDVGDKAIRAMRKFLAKPKGEG